MKRLLNFPLHLTSASALPRESRPSTCSSDDTGTLTTVVAYPARRTVAGARARHEVALLMASTATSMTTSVAIVTVVTAMLALVALVTGLAPTLASLQQQTLSHISLHCSLLQTAALSECFILGRNL